MKILTITYTWKWALTTFVILLCFSSCKKFIGVDLPKSQLIREGVFKDATTAEAAMVDIYARIRSQLVYTDNGIARLTMFTGLYADELDLYAFGSNQEMELMYFNNLIPTHSIVSLVWANSYNLVFAANSVIEGLEKASDTDILPQIKNQLTGEALFVRAFVHFYLANLYGNIPYVQSTDYLTNNKASRLPVEEVYQLLEKDLEKAASLLSVEYTGLERVRPNAAVAQSLLARVYLYHGKWGDAEQLATAVINNPLFTLQDDIQLVFGKGSQETIWQLSPGIPNGNSEEAKHYIYETGPPQIVALTTDFVQSFEGHDKRLSNWIGQVFDNSGNPYFFAHKYKYDQPTTPSMEYSIQHRLGELFLIRAEARIQMEDYTEACADLNKIRLRANLNSIASTSKEELMDILLLERHHELFLEYPHRFFDLVRTGNTSILATSKSGWNETDIRWPIPETELLVNPNLKPQNAGY